MKFKYVFLCFCFAFQTLTSSVVHGRQECWMETVQKQEVVTPTVVCNPDGKDCKIREIGTHKTVSVERCRQVEDLSSKDSAKHKSK